MAARNANSNGMARRVIAWRWQSLRWSDVITTALDWALSADDLTQR